MRSVRAIAPGRAGLEEVPRPGGGGIVVEPALVGICGTDIKVLAGNVPLSYPRIMGHEAVGRVVEAPAGSRFHPGDRVLVDPGVTCGHCALCLAGRTNLCLEGGLLGRELDGVFADLVSVPENQLLIVPDSIPDRAAGLLQVLGTCIHAQRAVQVFPGETVAVVGLGVAGQLMVQILRERGVDVVGITRSPWKLELAAAQGAVATATPDAAAGVLADLTDGRGPTLVVEAAGTEETLSHAIDWSAVGGRVLVFGTLTGGGTGLPYYQLYFKELMLHNPRGALIGDYATGIELTAAGRLDLEPLVTHTFDLAQVHDAFEAVSDPGALKVLMRVSGES